MDLEVSEEDDAFRSAVRAFADTEIVPLAAQWDRDRTLPVDVIGRMGDLGLFGLLFTNEIGGRGGELTKLCIAIEEVARADQAIALTLEAGVVATYPLYLFGTEEQRQEWLPDLATGRRLMGFCLTEPDSGSDAGGLRTTAVLDEATDEWVVNGEKSFVTSSGTEITSLLTVAALTNKPGERRELSTILVPAGTPGIRVGPSYRKVGWHASDTHPVVFHDCRVPAANLLGARGRGLANMLTALDDGRVAYAAIALGAIEACLGESRLLLEGNSVARGTVTQSVAFEVVDMAVRAEAARHLVYGAARRRDRGLPFKREAATAKLFAAESAVTSIRAAVQIAGMQATLDDSHLARLYRDAKVLEIAEGTNEIQRIVISRELGLPMA